MKSVLLAFMIFTSMITMAQSDKKANVKSTIEYFFDGFHKGDTTMMTSVMMDKVIMQTAYRNKEGADILVDEGGASKLLLAVANRPADQKWDERLLDFSIQVDGNMANAWVKYEFWFNDNFSHCGVNSFQLFNDSGKWKIIYLIDTRRRADCKQND